MIGNSKWTMESDLKPLMSVIHIVHAAQYTAPHTVQSVKWARFGHKPLLTRLIFL